MSKKTVKNYRKRLKEHKLRLFKKLFVASLFPLILILFVIIIQLSRPSPDKWETDNILLESISSTSVMTHKSTKTVAYIKSNDGRSFVLSQMKPEEASKSLTVGDTYEVVYSSEFGRLRVKGLSQNGNEIISRSDSASGYKTQVTTVIICCSIVFVIMLIVLTFVLLFDCKDEIKNIKRLKAKIKSFSPQPSPAEKVAAEQTDEESITK